MSKQKYYNGAYVDLTDSYIQSEVYCKIFSKIKKVINNLQLSEYYEKIIKKYEKDKKAEKYMCELLKKSLKISFK